MKSKSLPIVVIAYNRPRSLLRLLDSLSKAYYPNSKVPLIISIDHSDTNQDVLKIANEFDWQFGTKTVVYSEVNLGLRQHVLQCGNYAIKYGNVILLEDDLYVSPCFYEYTLQALEFSEEKSYIGGISLYNHQFNVHKVVPFTAIEDGFDNWYFQFASSWGQAWSRTHWEDFYNWYKNKDVLTANTETPNNVTAWSEKSWLKYYIVYLIEKNKFFLYPKVSLSTNFSDQGTHAVQDSNTYQVPLLQHASRRFNFSELEESYSTYDAFFENLKLHKFLEINKHQLCVDLNGYRTEFNKRYILTSQILNYEVIRTYGKSLKPIEANIISNIPGKEIFLYDSSKVMTNNRSLDKTQDIFYNIKYLSYRDAFYLFVSMTKKKLFNAINRK
ncbi:glycosyltransferase [Arenibacter latericius]|uniref:glycosyltransferase n=1 Tax=Arenibacter latericius TaxID=86104 RepID=UPI000404B232|nr:glycosyltransferase [Arenibacter latericius]